MAKGSDGSQQKARNCAMTAADRSGERNLTPTTAPPS